ncbi:FG-GAP-like repeat-containing protein, partial [Pirellulales bacterium]|nr:FG-GAP-like repeat-containing protein [Pirellulales bacterium]
GNRLEINHGGGIFVEQTPRLGSDGTSGSTLSDLNGDGHLDACLPTPLGNAVWLNDGLGALVDSGQLFGNEGAIAVTLGDLDGDGDLDAVTYHYDRFDLQQRPEIWINDGAGQFSSNGQRVDIFGLRTGALGDLDGDGDLDAYFANSQGPDQVWYNPTASELVDLSIENTNDSVQLAQGDALTYVVTVANHGTVDAFGATVRDTLPRELTGVELVSIETTGGGSSSLAAGSITTLTDSVNLPAGATIRYEIRGQVRAPTAANTATQFWLTNSAAVTPPAGFVDPLVADNLAVDADLVTLAATDGSANFVKTGQTLASNDAQDVLLGDLDGDGDLDAIAIYTDAEDEILLNDGGGNFTVGGTLSFEGANNTLSAALGDVDNDGDLDVFIVNDSRPGTLWLNQGDATFFAGGQNLNVANDPDAGFVSFVDIDADGNLDLVLGLEYFLNDGAGSFLDQNTFFNGNVSSRALGDLDGDGDLDALDGRSVMINDGTGELEAVGAMFSDTSSPWTLGDLDGDGDLDAVRGSYSDQQVWLNNGLAQFTLHATLPGSPSGEQMELVDADADGDLDAIVNERLGNIRVWINDGSANFSDIGSRFATVAATRFAVGDLDLNGTLDALVVHANEPGAVWLNQPAEGLVDLSIEIPDMRTVVTQGDMLSYVVTVRNEGDVDVTGATVANGFSLPVSEIRLIASFPQGNAQSSLTAGVLAGGIVDTVDLAAGSSLTYLLEVDLLPPGAAHLTAMSTLTHSATIEIPTSSAGDSLPGNNFASDTDLLKPRNVNGTGQFAVAQELDFPEPTERITLGDVDGDGDLDALISYANGGGALLLNSGNGQFVASSQAFINDDVFSSFDRTVAL